MGISQLCDKDNNVTFDSLLCRIVKLKNNQTFFTTLRSGSNYSVNFNKLTSHDVCILSEEDESWQWHMWIAHIHMDHLNKLISKELVNLCFEKNWLCNACQKGK